MTMTGIRVGGSAVNTAKPRAKQALDTVGRVAGTKAAKKFNPAMVAKDMRIGVVGSVPGDALFASQRYRRGELKANEYVADVLNTSLGFGAWTLGAAAVGAMLAPVGLPVFLTGVAGFAAGMVSNEIWNRTVGPSVKAGIAAGLPEKGAKAVADPFVKFVANPLTDWVWKPVWGFVKEHKLLSGAAVGLLALKFPVAARAVGKELGSMAGGMGVAMGVNMAVLDRWLPAPEEKAAPASGSALGELGEKIEVPARAKAYMRQRYADAFKGETGWAPERVADLEKVLYVRLLAETSSDAEQAEQLEAIADQMAARLEAGATR